MLTATALPGMLSQRFLRRRSHWRTLPPDGKEVPPAKLSLLPVSESDRLAVSEFSSSGSGSWELIWPRVVGAAGHASKAHPRMSPDVGTPVPAVTSTCSTSGTGFTEVPRSWRTPSAMPFMPWM